MPDSALKLNPSSKEEDRYYKPNLAGTIRWSSLGISLISLLVIGGFLLYSYRGQVHQQTTRQLQAMLANSVNTASLQVKLGQDSLDAISKQTDFLSAADPVLRGSADPIALNTVGAILSSSLVQNSQVVFDQMYISSTVGKILVSTQPDWNGTNLYQDERLKKALDNPSVLLIPYLKIFQQDQWVVLTAQPLQINGQYAGDIWGVSTLTAPTLAKEIAALYPGSSLFVLTDGYFAKVDANGDPGAAITLPAGYAAQIKPILQAAGQPALASYKGLDGAAVQSIGQQVPALNAAILIETPAQVVDSPLFKLIFPALLAALLILVAAGLYGWLLSRQVTRPLRQLIGAGQAFFGGDWQRRVNGRFSGEAGSLAVLFNHFAGDLSLLYKDLDAQVKEKTRHLKSATEVSQIITSANDITELFTKACNLAIERFNCYNASIYLVDDSGVSISLIQTSGPLPEMVNRKGYRIALNSQTLIGWTASVNQARIISNLTDYPFSSRDHLLPEIQTEAAIPIASSGKVYGVLHIQSDLADTFTPESIAVLQTLTTQVATAYLNYQHIQVTEDTLQGTNLLYEASHQIISAATEAEIFQVAAKALQHTPYQSALLSVEFDRLRFIEIYNPLTREQPDPALWEAIKIADIGIYLQPGKSFVIQELGKVPTALTNLVFPLRTIGGQAAAVVPIYCGSLLAGLIIISARDRTFLTPSKVQTFTSLGDIMGNALDKLKKLQMVQTRLEGLRAAAEIGINIALETDLQHLYKAVHSQILESMGDVNFMIALYQADTHMIEVPYMLENGEPVQLEPFPLGQGLTSILIKERKPLLLVNDVEKEATALGAKVVGAPAKSWLGVPLIVGEQVIGAMIVQDLVQEQRFTENDVEFLNSLVPQLTVSIRMAQNVGELEKSTQQLQTAAEIARDASSDLQLEKLLPHVVNLVKDRFGFYHASIFMLDPAGEYAVLRESTGEAGAQMKLAGHKLASGSKSIVGQTSVKGLPVVVNDVLLDPNYFSNPLLPNTRSEAGIPLKSGSRILGVLDVQSTVAGAFRNTDINILTLLADQLAVAMINAELFAETQVHLKQQRDLHQITSVAASRTTVHEALISTVRGLSSLLKNARVSIFLYNPIDETLEIQASVGYETYTAIDTLKIRAGEGVVGLAAKNRRIINIPDVKEENHYFSIDPTVCSEIAIPLIFHDSLVGILDLESEALNAFKEDDQEMLASLAGGLAGIITNTHLVEQNQLQMDREKQLYEITNKIRQSVDIKTIMEISTTEIGKILNARKATLEIVPGQVETQNQAGPVVKKNGRSSD